MKIAIISAHPDDEILGAGGTLLKHAKNGDEILWIIVTDIFEENGFTKDRVDSRHKEVYKVAKEMGFSKTVQLSFPTMSLSSESLCKLIPQLSKEFIAFTPEVIYCPNRTDAHSDHRIVFDAVWACTKSFRYPFIKQVLMFECISETEFAPSLSERSFIPNYFIDITNFVDKKDEIMKIYVSEIGEHPFPRSIRNIRALATFRGAIAGVEYAEGFQLLKFIDK
jgi:LmbE family N-acetylglucosaminyl deacetylase